MGAAGQLGSGSFTYGGYNGGAWDGTANVSGTLDVSFPPCSADFSEDFTGVSVSGYQSEQLQSTVTIGQLMALETRAMLLLH